MWGIAVFDTCIAACVELCIEPPSESRDRKVKLHIWDHKGNRLATHYLAQYSISFSLLHHGHDRVFHIVFSLWGGFFGRFLFPKPSIVAANIQCNIWRHLKLVWTYENKMCTELQCSSFKVLNIFIFYFIASSFYTTYRGKCNLLIDLIINTSRKKKKLLCIHSSSTSFQSLQQTFMSYRVVVQRLCSFQSQSLVALDSVAISSCCFPFPAC